MKKFLVETYYTCTFKTVHTLNDLNDKELSKIDERTDGDVEVLDVKLNNRKTKRVGQKDDKKIKNSKITNSIPESLTNKITNQSKNKEFEKSKIQFEKLSKNRNCKVLNAAISSTEKDVEFMEVIEGLTQMSGIDDDNYSAKLIIENNKKNKFNKNKMKTSTFEKSILTKEIDYLSIDIEGAELDVLKSINFQEYIIKVISVENNNPEKINFNSFLKENNFSFFDRVGQDEIFYNNKFFKLN